MMDEKIPDLGCGTERGGMILGIRMTVLMLGWVFLSMFSLLSFIIELTDRRFPLIPFNTFVCSLLTGWYILKVISKLMWDIEDYKQKLERTGDSEDAHKNYIEGHGRCSVVLWMRGDGKTDEEIAAYLADTGCSQSQIGVLLHPDENASPDAMTKYAQRLLGRA